MIENNETRPPCQDKQTSCMRAYSMSGGKIPCPLYDLGQCRPAKLRSKLALSSSNGRPPEWFAQQVEKSMHIDCPISDGYSSMPNERPAEKAMHEIYICQTDIARDNFVREKVMAIEETDETLGELLKKVARK